MFVQVIQGHVSDPQELKAAVDRWVRDIAPSAIGWLGTTGGVTDDGRAIAVVRFESEEAARRNSERPEQHQWWMETSKLYAGDVTFHDCPRVITFLRGGSDDAGFVQVIQGTTPDMQRLEQLSEESTDQLSQGRPDIIGGLHADHGNGGFTDTIYFASEQAAREGERREPPPEMRAGMEEWQGLMQDVTYHDLKEPWLHSSR